MSEDLAPKTTTEQSITKAAKVFIENPNASSSYLDVVNSIISKAISVIESKVEREAARQQPIEETSTSR